MRRFQDRNIVIIILIAVALLTVGYSALAYTLSLGGTAHFRTFWDVHFENAQALDGSMSLSQGDSGVTIDSTNPLKVNYSLTFTNVTDYYEFSVDIVNEGTMDGMIDSIVPLVNGNSFENLPSYLEYSIVYDDTCAIDEKQLLSAGETEAIIFRVGVKSGTLVSELSPNSIPFSLEIVFAVADNTAVEVDRPFVYNVLRREVENEGLAAEYTGTHKDSFTVNGNKKIYHWYADNASDGADVLDKNNVILGGICWQIIRTTDTGGVRMIYNGEEDNGECQSNRGTHLGIQEGNYTTNLDHDYYYADDYTYDENTSLFTLSGTKVLIHWSDNDYSGAIRKYTCLSNDPDATCATLTFVEEYYSSTNGYTLVLNTNAPYYSIGMSAYNQKGSSPSSVGYMSNIDYLPVSQKFDSNLNLYTSQTGISNGSYYVSTSFSYSDVSDQYTLVNLDESTVTKDVWKNNYQSYVGKYTCLKGTNTTCDSVYYIASTALNGIHYIPMSHGQLLNDVNTTMYFASSYSGNQLNNPVPVTLVDWVSSHSYAGYYFCSDYTETTCSGHVYAVKLPANTYISYYSDEDVLKYGTEVSYDKTNHVYTISGTTVNLWNYGTNSNAIQNYRYTCNNTTGTCSEVRYVISQSFNSTGSYSYITLNGEEDIDEAKDNMFFAQGVNTNSSEAKFLVDEWYRKNFISNASYLEDSIFCADRTISNLGFLDSTSTITTGASIGFNAASGTTGLLCSNVTDQFSVANQSAHLTYPVGLASLSELYLLGDNSIRSIGIDYWTMTPHVYSGGSDVKVIKPNGDTANSQVAVTISKDLRPVISLKPGVKYTSGDGSKDTPYRID